MEYVLPSEEVDEAINCICLQWVAASSREMRREKEEKVLDKNVVSSREWFCSFVIPDRCKYSALCWVRYCATSVYKGAAL